MFAPSRGISSGAAVGIAALLYMCYNRDKVVHVLTLTLLCVTTKTRHLDRLGQLSEFDVAVWSVTLSGQETTGKWLGHSERGVSTALLHFSTSSSRSRELSTCTSEGLAPLLGLAVLKGGLAVRCYAAAHFSKALV